MDNQVGELMAEMAPVTMKRGAITANIMSKDKRLLGSVVKMDSGNFIATWFCGSRPSGRALGSDIKETIAAAIENAIESGNL